MTNQTTNAMCLFPHEMVKQFSLDTQVEKRKFHPSENQIPIWTVSIGFLKSINNCQKNYPFYSRFSTNAQPFVAHPK